MKYNPSLIEVEEEVINGKKVKIQKIPTGMSGPNAVKAKVNDSYNEGEKEDEYSRITKNDELLKEYNEYMNEGIEPDSDEVRAIKTKIEKNNLFEEIEEENYEID